MKSVEVPTRTLVHALIRADGTVHADELYDVAALLGMSDQQVRLTIKRLVTDGRFTQEGRGRKALLRTTADTERTRAPDVEFVRHAFRQDAGLAPWDGVWHLVAFAVPEARRTARDALREQLGQLGGSPLQGGLYVCANAWEPYVEDEARRLGVLDGVTFVRTDNLRRGDEQDPVALARALWPQQEIAARYERLAEVARQRLDHFGAARTPAERLTAGVELAAEFTRAMEPDPLLPPELLPRPWAGAVARELTARCWALLERQETADGNTEARPRLFQLYDDVVREAAGRAS
ncbi:PaaX family transcriptional regulator C-terminal domain-containing protein [Streptomyces sp. 21So2-11]|uniref:PaaX family transcriptional regulator C-terminal domain-containing protein n=1 Tax=Streptomyces sp. 21So2-11 TaxID=3144408 RepID=UPI00321BE462